MLYGQGTFEDTGMRGPGSRKDAEIQSFLG